MKLAAVNSFHETRPGHLVFGLVELGVAYLIGSWAVNDGNLWLWALAVILLFGGLQNGGRLLILTIREWRRTMY